jgi:hypothetical protein
MGSAHHSLREYPIVFGFAERGFVGAMDSMQLFQTTTYSGIYSSYKCYSTTIIPIIPNVPNLCVG